MKVPPEPDVRLGRPSSPAPAPVERGTTESELHLLSVLAKGTAEALEQIGDMLKTIAADLVIIKAALVTPQQLHDVEPSPDQDLHPVFDAVGREVDWEARVGLGFAWDYPLTATCRCGRQITLGDPRVEWQHCD